MKITTLRSTAGSSVQIAHHGAHVLSWIPANQTEQLFLSTTSSFAPDKAIRGGVPVIFPQFSDHGPLPKHGFARNQEWHRRPSDLTDTAVFVLHDSDASRAVWPFQFIAELTITVSDSALLMTLAIHNIGATMFTFTAALHTYFRVAAIADARILGLKNCPYEDSVTGQRDCVEVSESIAIHGLVDRIYGGAPVQLEIQQSQQRLIVQRDNFPDVVVWNPWQELSASMPDMEPDGYQHMLCVESAAIAAPVFLQPGKVWQATQQFHVT